MYNRIVLLPVVLLLCAAFACQKQRAEVAKQPHASVEADAAAIKTLMDEWVQLYNARDFDKLMSVFYAENSMLMSPNASSQGKEAILRGFRKDDELNEEHVDSSVVEDVRVSGDLGVARGKDTGTTTPRNGGKPEQYDLKWLIAFERQSDGSWKCIYEMWNDNPPQVRSGSPGARVST